MLNTIDHRTAVLDKAQQLVAMLNQSEEMNRFRQAEYKINNHADAQALMFVVKAKRNKFSQVSLRHGYEHPASLQAEQEYRDVLDRIAQIPLIDEFKDSQDDINDILQGILKTVMVTVSDVLPVEKSEDPGDSASGGCGSCSSSDGCGKH